MLNRYLLAPLAALLLAAAPFAAQAQTSSVGICDSSSGQKLEVAGGSLLFSIAGQSIVFADGSTQTTANRALILSGQNLTLSGAGGNTVTLPAGTEQLARLLGEQPTAEAPAHK